jgi:Uma2 family endonuclease
MIAMTSQIPQNEHVATADLHVYMRVDWAGFESLLALRGEARRPRMAYLDGVVELMTTTWYHERIKGVLSQLVAIYLDELGIEFGMYGEWTLKDPAAEAGVEGDQCFQLGPDQRPTRWPDLAIEVVWTHGDMNKLEIYRRLGVREVWVWEDDAIVAYALADSRYIGSKTSSLVPNADLNLLCEIIKDSRSTSEAMKRLKAALKTP